MAQNQSQTPVSDIALESLQMSKKQRTFLIVTISLLLLSAVILGIRIADYAQQDKREVALKVDDSVEMNIFSIFYTSANGEVTVQSANGDKVVAPGTKFDQVIRVRNADEYAINFALEPKVVFSTRYQIPLQVRMKTADGEYILGSAEEWVSLQDLRSLEYTGTLQKAGAAEFIFEWMWPYEGDDNYDTIIGNEDREVGLELSFEFHAAVNTSLEANGGWEGHPDMGKNIALAASSAIFLASIVAVTIVIIKKRKAALAGIKDPEYVPQAQEKKAEPIATTQTVSLEMLAANFPGAAVINLATLKQKGMVPISTKSIHVDASPNFVLNKPLVIFAKSFSPDAKRIIAAAGGAAVFGK